MKRVEKRSPILSLWRSGSGAPWRGEKRESEREEGEYAKRGCKSVHRVEI